MTHGLTCNDTQLARSGRRFAHDDAWTARTNTEAIATRAAADVRGERSTPAPTSRMSSSALPGFAEAMVWPA
jgi:hypothetical protein